MGEWGKWDIRLIETGQGKSEEGPFPKSKVDPGGADNFQSPKGSVLHFFISSDQGL